MEANQRRSRWTYAEFARLPSEEGTRHEIIDGHLVGTPSPSVPHQRVAMQLLRTLDRFVLEHGLGEILPGPVDVLFAEGDYLVPDGAEEPAVLEPDDALTWNPSPGGPTLRVDVADVLAHG